MAPLRFVGLAVRLKAEVLGRAGWRRVTCLWRGRRPIGPGKLRRGRRPIGLGKLRRGRRPIGLGKPRRVEVPLFETVACPAIRLDDVKARRLVLFGDDSDIVSLVRCSECGWLGESWRLRRLPLRACPRKRCPRCATDEVGALVAMDLGGTDVGVWEERKEETT